MNKKAFSMALALAAGSVLAMAAVTASALPQDVQPEPETVYIEVPVETVEYRTVEKVVYEPVYIEREARPFTADELYCLAAAIYQEGGGDAVCDECRFRIGDVILNRVADERFPDSIRAVLEAPYQYGTLWKTGVKWPDRAYNTGEQAAVIRAWHTAARLLSGEHSGLYGEGYVWQAEFAQGADGFWHCGVYYGR